MINHERLLSLVSYNPENGSFTRLIATSRRIKVGDEAGWINALGYRYISLDGKGYNAHRLAWFYMTGEWPEKEIDHINRIRSDNRFSNLRQASSSQNNANIAPRHKTKSGLKGVSWDRDRKKWYAKIQSGYKTINIGRFDCPAAAHIAYQIEADRIFGGFARISQ